LLFVFAFDAADTLFWRLRPRPLATVLEIRSLPTADCGSPRIADATSVQFGDSFLIIGGQSTNAIVLDSIYLYNLSKHTWTLIARMTEAKWRVIAVLMKRKMLMLD
jgi:hypothetical protein